MRKVVYISHPLGQGPDREKNRQNAKRWVCWAALAKGVSPIADWITLSEFWDESKRDIGLDCDVAAVAKCDELWHVGGRISTGMRVEEEAARAAGIPVIDLTELGYEPPAF